VLTLAGQNYTCFRLGGARQVTDLRHVITGGCKSGLGGMAYYWFPPKEMQPQLTGRHTLE
jgi:hypothetical protein